MITVTQARENDRTTYCRQFTYNPKGEYNSRRDGAIVSGMPVAGIAVSELPIGSKIALTAPDKVSINPPFPEIGYICVQKNEDNMWLVPDNHVVLNTWRNRDSAAQKFLEDMTEKAKSVVTLVQGALSRAQARGGIAYFDSNEKRVFHYKWWLNDQYDSSRAWYVEGNGDAGASKYEGKGTQNAIRPLVSIPLDVLVSAEPNAAGAYELL